MISLLLFLFRWFRRLILYPVLILLVILVSAILITHLFTTPSNNRDWADDQAILSYADIGTSTVTIHNIRNFSYTSTSDYTPNYYDKTFNLDDIKRVWYVVEPFSDFKGAAHTFLSFEFKDNNFVSISIEIRKEKGEKFSAWKGAFDKYEIMYVIADERDVINLRANYRHDQVFVYPMKSTPEKVRALFLDMLARTNKLKDQPEFYNSIYNNCTNNIAKHVDAISPHKVPLISFSYILPAKSDYLAYKLGLIDTDLSFPETRAKFLINDKAQKYADDPEFSAKIRE